FLNLIVRDRSSGQGSYAARRTASPPLGRETPLYGQSLPVSLRCHKWRSTAANGFLVACRRSKCKGSRMAAAVALRGAFAHRSKTVSIEKKNPAASRQADQLPGPPFSR